LFKLYYLISILITYFNPFTDNNSLYNIFLIKINNIKINFIFINLIANCLQNINILPIHILLSLWILNITNTKYLTISNFYQGYVKIHPNLQYIGSIFYAYININKKLNFKINKYLLVAVIIVSFILGSLWALYQSIWGYYWSNDSIEYILLIILSLLLIKMHKYCIKKVNNQIIIILIVLLLMSLRLNLLHTKHNFFSKASTTKNFIFFVQISFLQYLQIRNKLKNKQINLNLISLITLIYIIYINMLNAFLVKEILFLVITYVTNKFVFYIYKIHNKKLLHLIFYLFFYIYLLINIKYLLINYQLINILKKNTNFFFFVHNNHLLLIKQLNAYSNTFKIKYLTIKNFNLLHTSKHIIKKLVNYF